MCGAVSAVARAVAWPCGVWLSRLSRVESVGLCIPLVRPAPGLCARLAGPAAGAADSVKGLDIFTQRETQINACQTSYDYCSRAANAWLCQCSQPHITTTTSATSRLDLRPLPGGDTDLAVVALVALTLPWIFLAWVAIALLGRFLERTDDFAVAFAVESEASDSSTVAALP